MSIFSDFDAAYGEGQYSGIPSSDGGTDIFHDGSIVDHVNPQNGALSTDFVDGDFVINTPNLNGGTDTFVNGEESQHTQSNIFGGTDTYDDNGELEQTTIPNAESGVDIYGQDMDLEGMSVENIYGSEDMISFGDDGSSFMDSGNFDSMMEYSDPLSYAADNQMATFDLNETY